MTLGFSTKWGSEMGSELKGKPTYFLDKIWQSLIEEKLCTLEDARHYANEFSNKFDAFWNVPSYTRIPKLHTIRKGNRWREGMKIHFVINNRTKDRFQFAPVIECTGVQEIGIIYDGKWGTLPTVVIDGIKYNTYLRDFRVIQKLAKNDGFESIEDFFKYFNEDFKGQIVHWTKLRY